MCVRRHVESASAVDDSERPAADNRAVSTTNHDRTLAVDPHAAAALLVAWRRGRPGAVDDLIRLCGPFVRRQAELSVWRRDDVEDVMQEVWIKFVRKGTQIRDPLSLLAWLRIVTRRVAAHHARRAGPVAPTSVPDEQAAPASTENDAIERYHRDEVGKRVRTALDRLPERDRAMLLLLHRDDRPGYGEIGRAVQRPVGSLGPSRRRLLDRLREDRRLAALCDLPAAS
jgi:RNA polymerase sigma factor (sigma-70 family)